MRVKLKTLRKVIKEYVKDYNKVLKEQIRLADDSLDKQIDSILLGFESESVVPDVSGPLPVYQEAHIFDRFMDSILNEAEKGLPPPNPNDKEEEPPQQDLTKGSEEVDTTQPPVEPPKNKINIDQYAKKVARLIKNYQNLLDPKTVIYMRAKNLLINSYDENTAEEFSEVLSSEFGINIDGVEGLEKTELPARPYAPGATPSST